MTYPEILALRNSPTLKSKAAVAVAIIADYVLNYVLGANSPAIPGVTLNVLLNAQRAKEDPLVAADKFMWAIAMDGTVQSEGEAATDAHVHAVVNSKYTEVWR